MSPVNCEPIGFRLCRVRLLSERDFATDFYYQMRDQVTGRKSRDQKRISKMQEKRSQPFDKGREPITAISGVDALMQDFRWQSQLEQADLFIRWAEVVGEINAKNSQPESITKNKLTVRCKSTAWATELRLMQQSILQKIASQFPQLGITQIAFIGPDAPSWKKGPRSVPGRGPRDTYG